MLDYLIQYFAYCYWCEIDNWSKEILMQSHKHYRIMQSMSYFLFFELILCFGLNNKHYYIR